MGKGDKRTKKGKIFAGSHGKTRPKHRQKAAPAAAAARAATAEAVPKKTTRRKKAEGQEA